MAEEKYVVPSEIGGIGEKVGTDGKIISVKVVTASSAATESNTLYIITD